MNLPIVLRSEAEAEFDESFDWYETQLPGLGVRFASAIQDVFDGLSTLPLKHAIVIADVRKATVYRFPFTIFYRPHPDRVEIIAVHHTSRDPSVWQSRIGRV